MLLLFLSCTGDQEDSGGGVEFPDATVIGHCDPSLASGLPDGVEDCSQSRCKVEEGEFWMGSDFSATECPVHSVWLDEFWIDQYEVTIDQWEQCVNQGGCDPLPLNCTNPLRNRPDYSTDFPAVCVTWTQAQSYCGQLGGRLPTEAEWEKAAAGVSSAKWAWGGISPTCEDANFRLASLYCAPGIKSVGSYPHTSAYGLYDVNGNVFEWVLDWYDSEFYSIAERNNPVKQDGDCQNTLGGRIQECSNRGLRGGAYNTTESTMRNASRSFANPSLVDVNIGFRCVYE